MHPPVTVSSIQLVPVRPTDGLVAFATFVLDGKYSVAHVAIRTRLDGGLRITFPTKILRTGKELPCFLPTSSEISRAIEEAVLAKYEALTQRYAE